MLSHSIQQKKYDLGFGKIYLLFMKFWDLYSSPPSFIRPDFRYNKIEKYL